MAGASLGITFIRHSPSFIATRTLCVGAPPVSTCAFPSGPPLAAAWCAMGKSCVMKARRRAKAETRAKKPKAKGKAKAASLAARKQKKEAVCLMRRLLNCHTAPPFTELLLTPPLVVRVGSDCSGYGSEYLALKLSGVNVQTVFCSEVDAKKRAMLRAVHRLWNPGMLKADFKLFKDAARKDCPPPACDVFVAGPPCPAYSSMGRNGGLYDVSQGGHLMLHCLDYITQARPRVCVIENVSGFARRHRNTLARVRQVLKRTGYDTHVRLLNTMEHGLPHSRPRVYIVGLLAPRCQFKWPKTMPQARNVHAFLDTTIGDKMPSQDQIAWFEQKAGSAATFWNEWRVVSLGSSATRRHLPPEGTCPCITRSHASAFKYYVPVRRRFLSLAEMARLQGVPRKAAMAMVKAADGNERAVAGALGDAMSVNVLMRLLPRALHAGGLLADLPLDVWRSSNPVNPDALLP